jgi:type I restriction-modification system DNA methylase subunit
VLYAESEGRDLLDTNNEIYEESYSLNSLKQDIAEELDSPSPKYRDWQDTLWDRLDELFKLIDQGSQSRRIPKEDLYIPAYNGGLFRTDPDEDDSNEAQFLASHQVGDAYLARVIELLTRSQNGNGGGKIFVDYSSLDVRHLGSIYEGLLEYQLDVASEPLTLEDGEYVPASEGDEVVVEEGEVHLMTGSGERKATGSYYTPEYVVEYIVEETLGPLVDNIRETLVGQTTYRKGDHEAGTFADEFAEHVFDLKILDPAMGSGHFLTSAIDYLAREIIDAQEKQAAQQGIETVDEEHDINWARRQVAQRCIYGVDLNPLAVELTKVSLWLRTLAAEQPLAFLDHHLKTGNSLVGSDIEDVLSDGDEDATGGQLTLQQSFDHTRQRAMEHVTDRFQDLLNIDNETLEDAKEMEAVYDDVRADPLYKKLLAMANVHTADAFGLDVPDDADERMARALHSDAWKKIEQQGWFKSAQAMAEDERFFHWELEFPVAFYDEDGKRKIDVGFDAVIGNPPYFNLETVQGTPFNKYLRAEYDDIYSGKADILYFFIDKGNELFQKDGSLSYIISRYFTEAYNAKDLRELISESMALDQIVDFGNNQVFPGVDTLTIILKLSKQESVQETEITQLSDELNSNSSDVSLALENIESGRETDLATQYTVPSDSFGRERWLLLPKEVREIKEQVRSHGTRLGDFCRTGQGMMTGLNKAFTVTDTEIEEWDIEDAVLKPLVKNGDLRPYLYRGNNKKLIYLENKEISDYPATESYLETYRDDLLNRAKAGDIRWYRYQNPINKDLFEDLDEKVICPFIATDNRFYLDKEGLYNDGGDIEIISQKEEQLTNESLIAICNSDLLEFYHLNHAKLKRDGFYEYFGNSLQDLPINTTPEQLHNQLADRVDELVDTSPSTTHEALSTLTEQMLYLKDGYKKLNLDLLNYLGNYDDGPNLPDVGLFQPSESNVLDATTEEYEKLRVGDVRAERDGTRVTISATARYKPEDQDAHETDTYGYIETDFVEAFTLVDCSEAEAALVAAFVPVAVDDEIAGFRANATKTNSLVDRLKAITLPDPDDVADDLDRYVDTKERADELDEKIKKTDQLIDEIVYDLYALTDEEIEIVESAVQDD